MKSRVPRVEPRRAAWIGLAVLAAALAGCATAPTVRVMQVPEVAACRSLGPLPAGAGQPIASILDQKLRTAVLRALAEAGHDTRAAAPGCWITATTARSVPVTGGPGVSLGVGGVTGGSVGVGVGLSIPIGGTGVRETLRLTVDVVDARRRQQVWSGTVDDAFSSSTPSDADIDRVVRAVAAKFPAPPAR